MPQFRREWELPENIGIEEFLDKPSGWGKSYFWYCTRCGEPFAYARLYESAVQRLAPFRSYGSVCPDCPSDKWQLAGSIEALDFVGESLPRPILEYQLSVELKFLDHPNHPYNEKEC